MGNTDVETVQFNEKGLVPAIAQDVRTGEIRMLAYMNEEALEKTKETGYVHYWSRSREELWKKGATSGELQQVVSLRSDCDKDAILVLIRQQGGGACHTGSRNCFYNEWDEETWEEIDPFPAILPGAILGELEEIIEKRDQERPSDSYTTRLLQGIDGKSGEDTVLEKIGEEVTELILASKNNDHENLSEEIGDLLYHLLVLARIKDCSLMDISTVLNDRRS